MFQVIHVNGELGRLGYAVLDENKVLMLPAQMLGEGEVMKRPRVVPE